MIDEDLFSDGTMFDGSSIAGWKAINESDMTLMPDPTTAVMDPFFAAPTLSIVCDVLEPSTGEPYSRDPRGMARKAEAYAAAAGIGDAAYFGPEAEFFVFDDVRFSTNPYDTGFVLDSTELPTNSDTPYEAATSATAFAPRADTSRCPQWIPRRTCVARCWRRWRRWAPRSRSTTTRWRPPSTNSGSSSAR